MEIDQKIKSQLPSAGSLNSGDLLNRIQTFNTSIDLLKGKVYENINSKYEEFSLAFDRTNQLKIEVDKMSSEIDEMKDLADELEKTRNEPANNRVRLQRSLKENDDIMSCLLSLSEIQELLSSFDDLLDMNDFYNASLNVCQMRTILDSLKIEFCDLTIITTIKEEFVNKKSQLRGTLEDNWIDCISFSDSFLSVKQKRKGNEVISKFPEICISMQLMETLNNRLSLFSHNVVDLLLKPIAEDSSLSLAIESISNATSLKIISNEQILEENRIESGLKKFYEVLHFVYHHCLELQQSSLENESITGDASKDNIIMKTSDEVLELFINQIRDDVENLLIEFVQPYLSQMTSEKANQLSKMMTDFALKTKTEFNLEFSPKLSDFDKNLKTTVLSKERDDLLGNARQLIASFEPGDIVEVSDHEEKGLLLYYLNQLPSETINKIRANNEFFDGLSTSGLKLPTCQISVSTKKLMDFIFNVLEEACDSSQPSAMQVFYTVRDIFELYRAISPLQRSQIIGDDASNIIFHNDCMYIAHHLLFLGYHFRALPLLTKACTFVDMVSPYREIGQNAYITEIKRQNDKNMKIIDQCQGFKKVVLEERYSLVENKFKELLERAMYINKRFKVLPQVLHLKTMMNLLNYSLKRIVDEFLSVTDIAADDASQLVPLLSLLKFKIPNILGVDMESVETSKYIPNYKKLVDLIDILDLSMKDIMQSYEEGKWSFSNNELKSLIKALFQSTENRQRCLAQLNK